MKKLLVLLLTILVLTSVALIAVACSDSDETTETTAAVDETATTVAESTALTPAEVKVIGEEIAAEYAAAGEGADMTTFSGGEVTFAGPVLSISEKADKYIVSIGTADASFPLCFYKDDLAGLGVTVETLNAWIGQNVEVTGEVVLNPFGSASEIVITDAAQVVIK